LGEGAPGVFDFLGFTRYCGHSRAGKFKLKRRTAKKKFRTKLTDLKSWLRSKLTTPIEEVWPTINQKLQGHYQYYGINDNWPWLMRYLKGVQLLVFRWLRRHSQKGKTLSLSSFWQYRDRHPFALPKKLTDLIASYR